GARQPRMSRSPSPRACASWLLVVSRRGLSKPVRERIEPSLKLTLMRSGHRYAMPLPRETGIHVRVDLVETLVEIKAADKLVATKVALVEDLVETNPPVHSHSQLMTR